jgi:hypothetical protein
VSDRVTIRIDWEQPIGTLLLFFGTIFTYITTINLVSSWQWGRAPSDGATFALFIISSVSLVAGLILLMWPHGEQNTAN